MVFHDKQKAIPILLQLHLLQNVHEMAGNIKTIIENAVKDAQTTDFIMLVRNQCITVISVEDFIKDITFGGQAVCDTLLNCWKSMGQFDGGTNPDNGDDEECDCSEDFVKIHFPKGEGIKVITAEEYIKVPDSIYVRPIGTDKYRMTVVDEEGNERFAEMPEIPTVDYPIIDGNSVGVGVPFYRGITSEKINIASLYSESMIVSEYQGGTRIELAGGDSVSNDWYLDANFQRPSNWGQPLNLKEEITYLSSMAMIDPAIYTNGQVVKVPSGTLNDPFKTYEEYLLKRIYGAGGSGTGTPSKHNPKYPVKTLQLLSSFSTSSDLEVINTTLYLKNFITLTYTGTRLYGLDYRTIYDALTVSGNLQIAIDNIIKGEGIITSINNFGLIYSKTDSIKTSNGNSCVLQIIPEGRGLYFIEGNTTIAYTPLTKNGGGDLKYGNNTVLGANQSPITPLIVIEGKNSNYFNTNVIGTKFFIQSNTQIGIRCFNSGTINSGSEQFAYQVGNINIGYESRIDNTSSGVDLEIVNFYEDVINGKVYYKPYDNYVMLRAEDNSYIRIENLSTEANGFQNAGMNSIVSLSENARFENVSEIKDVGGAPALNFLKVVGSTTSQYFNKSDIGSRYFNFIKGDGTNTVNIYFKNSQIDPRNISTNIGTLNVHTLGTLSSIKGNPIITLSEYTDEAQAKSLGGLVTGMIFKTSGTHEIVNVTNP